MALNYSNLSSTNTAIGGQTTPATLALNNKIAPQPLVNIGALSPKPFVPLVPKPSTPVKKITNTDGSTVEFHAPAKTATSSTSAPVSTSAPAPTSTTLAQDQTTAGNQGQPGYDALGNPLASTTAAPTTSAPSPVDTSYPGLIKSLATVGTQGSAGYSQAVKNLSDFDRALAQKYGAIESTPIPLNFQQGREQVIAKQAASERDALQQAVTQEQTQQGQQIGALGTAASLTPDLLRYGGTGTSGAVAGAQLGANFKSAGDFQTAINTIQAAAPAADAAFSVLNSYTKGFSSDTPILSGLSQLYGSTAQGNEAVAGFKAQLQAVRSAWAAIEGTDGATAIPDNVTGIQLSQIQQQLKTDAANKVAGYQNQLKTLSSTSGGAPTTTGGTVFGSFF